MDMEPLSGWNGAVQRIVMAVVASGALGAGTVLLTNARSEAVHEQRITELEKQLVKIDAIDRNLISLGGKVDVINQKLDDAIRDQPRDHVR